MNIWLLPPLIAALASAATVSRSRISETINGTTSERLLTRTKRNKFVQKFLEKSKASPEKLNELEGRANTHEWPVIAWKENSDVFQIGDDSYIESSPFDSLVEEEDIPVEAVTTVSNFALKSASSYTVHLEKVRSRIAIYNNTFLSICFLLCVTNFLLVFIRYWLIGLSKLILRASLQIEFKNQDGPTRQEFIYAMAFAVEDDLLENPANKTEQGFAACINDIVVAVESYTKIH